MPNMHTAAASKQGLMGSLQQHWSRQCLTDAPHLCRAEELHCTQLQLPLHASKGSQAACLGIPAADEGPHLCRAKEVHCPHLQLLLRVM